MSIHADDRAYKPLNWMNPPCTLKEDGERHAGPSLNKAGEQLILTMEEVLHDSSHELGVDPGLIKDGVEAHLQELLADHIDTLGDGYTPDPPRVPDGHRPGRHPVPRRGRRRRSRSRSSGAARSTASSSSPATWSCSTATRCSRPVRGVFAAQEIKPQARVLAADRGIDCVTLDYDALRGIEPENPTLF